MAKLDKAGVFEFNPYEGKEPITIVSPKTKCKVFNNPGFAPYSEIDYPDSQYGFSGFAPISGHFRDSYYSGHKHAGVDFDGVNLIKENRSNKTETPIKSLIYATYIGEGNYGNKHWGRFIVFQSQSNKKHFFILAHLSETAGCIIDFSKNENIYPGMIVGYVGNTGNCSNCSTQAGRDAGNGAHLHVQLVVAEETKRVFNLQTNTLEPINQISINPFDYTDVYSNPIRETI